METNQNDRNHQKTDDISTQKTNEDHNKKQPNTIDPNEKNSLPNTEIGHEVKKSDRDIKLQQSENVKQEHKDQKSTDQKSAITNKENTNNDDDAIEDDERNETANEEKRTQEHINK